MLWENNPENWAFSGRETAYTFKEILQLIESASGLKETEQVRWMIVLNKNGASIGTLDLFDYNVVQQTVAVGILINEVAFRQKVMRKKRFY